VPGGRGRSLRVGGALLPRSVGVPDALIPSRACARAPPSATAAPAARLFAYSISVE
jgi:hypothetical protein